MKLGENTNQAYHSWVVFFCVFPAAGEQISPTDIAINLCLSCMIFHGDVTGRGVRATVSGVTPSPEDGGNPLEGFCRHKRDLYSNICAEMLRQQDGRSGEMKCTSRAKSGITERGEY